MTDLISVDGKEATIERRTGRLRDLLLGEPVETGDSGGPGRARSLPTSRVLRFSPVWPLLGDILYTKPMTQDVKCLSSSASHASHSTPRGRCRNLQTTARSSGARGGPRGLVIGVRVGVTEPLS